MANTNVNVVQQIKFLLETELDEKSKIQVGKDLKSILEDAVIAFDKSETEKNLKPIVAMINSVLKKADMPIIDEGSITASFEKIANMSADTFQEAFNAAIKNNGGIRLSFNDMKLDDIIESINKVSESIEQLGHNTSNVKKSIEKDIRDINAAIERMGNGENADKSIQDALQYKPKTVKSYNKTGSQSIDELYNEYDSATNWEEKTVALVKYKKEYDSYLEYLKKKKPTEVESFSSGKYGKLYKRIGNDFSSMVGNLENILVIKRQRETGVLDDRQNELVDDRNRPWAREKTLQEVNRTLKGGLKVSSDGGGGDGGKPVEEHLKSELSKREDAVNKSAKNNNNAKNGSKVVVEEPKIGKKYTMLRAVEFTDDGREQKKQAVDTYGAEYWSRDIDTVKSYADDHRNQSYIIKGNIVPKNPLIIDANGFMWNDWKNIPQFKELFPGLRELLADRNNIDDDKQKYINEQARAAGFDAVILKNVQDNKNADLDTRAPTTDTIAVLDDSIVKVTGSIRELTETSEILKSKYGQSMLSDIQRYKELIQKGKDISDEEDEEVGALIEKLTANLTKHVYSEQRKYFEKFEDGEISAEDLAEYLISNRDSKKSSKVFEDNPSKEIPDFYEKPHELTSDEHLSLLKQQQEASHKWYQETIARLEKEPENESLVKQLQKDQATAAQNFKQLIEFYEGRNSQSEQTTKSDKNTAKPTEKKKQPEAQKQTKQKQSVDQSAITIDAESLHAAIGGATDDLAKEQTLGEINGLVESLVPKVDDDASPDEQNDAPSEQNKDTVAIDEASLKTVLEGVTYNVKVVDDADSDADQTSLTTAIESATNDLAKDQTINNAKDAIISAISGGAATTDQKVDKATQQQIKQETGNQDQRFERLNDIASNYEDVDDIESAIKQFGEVYKQIVLMSDGEYKYIKPNKTGINILSKIASGDFDVSDYSGIEFQRVDKPINTTKNISINTSEITDAIRDNAVDTKDLAKEETLGNIGKDLKTIIDNTKQKDAPSNDINDASPEQESQEDNGEKMRTAIMQELAKYGTLEEALKAGGKRIQFDGSEVHFGSFVSEYLDKFLGQDFDRGIYEDLWKEARQQFYKFEPVELTKEDAINIIREKIPDNLLEGWFRKGDSEYKPLLEQAVMSDDEIRNAALNIMWSNFKEFSGKDIGFEEFLNSEIPMYRGKNSENYTEYDDLLSFSFDPKVAEKFGKYVLETLIKPIETIGSLQTTGEAEALVYRKPLESRAEYKKWHDDMANVNQNLENNTSRLLTEEDVRNAEEAYDSATRKVNILTEELTEARKELEKLQQQADLYGYGSDMSPQQVGRVRSTLSKPENAKTSQNYSRAQYVVDMLKKGYNVAKTNSGDYGFARHDIGENVYNTITKTEYDYAVYLSEKIKELNVGWEEGLKILQSQNGQLEAAQQKVTGLESALSDANSAKDVMYDAQTVIHNAYNKQQNGQTEDSTVANNQKKIKSYEELVAIVNRYFELKSKLRDINVEYNDGIDGENYNPPIFTAMESIESMLENAQLDASNMDVFNALHEDGANAESAAKRIAAAIGIEVEQQERLNESMRDGNTIEQSDNSQSEIAETRAETAAIEQRRDAQIGLNEAMSQEPDAVPENPVSHVNSTALVPTNINDVSEVNDMTTLLTAVQAVTEAVKLKTRAFNTERSAVQLVVEDEVKSLDVLENKLISIKQTLEGLMNNVGAGASDLASGLSNVNINVNYPENSKVEFDSTAIAQLVAAINGIPAKQQAVTTTAVGNVPATENTLLIIKESVAAINSKIGKGTKSGGGYKKTTKSDYTGSAFFGEKIKTRELELGKFVQQLNNTGKNTQKLQDMIRQLQTALQAVNSGESLSVYDQMFRQVKLLVSIDDLQRAPAEKDKIADYKQLIKFAKEYYKLVEKYEKAEDGSNRKRVLGNQKDAIEKFMSDNGIDLGNIALDDDNYNKQLSDLRIKHSNNMAEIDAANKDKSNKKALQEEQAEVKKLIDLYRALGEEIAKRDYAETKESKDAHQQTINEIAKKIRGNAYYDKVNKQDAINAMRESAANKSDSLRQSQADKAGAQRVRDENKALKEQEKTITELEAMYKNLGKAMAEVEVNGDLKKKERASQLQKEIDIKIQGLKLEKDEEDTLREKLNIIKETEKEKSKALLVAQNKQKDNKKELNKQVRTSRQKARIGRANSTINGAEDAIYNASVIDSVDASEVAAVQSLNTELEKLKGLYAAIQANDGVVNESDAQQLVNQARLVKAHATELNKLLQQYERLSGDNVKEIVSYDAKGNLEKQLINAAKAATNGRAEIKGFNAETGELVAIVKGEKNSFTECTYAVREYDNQIVQVTGTTKKMEGFMDGILRKMKEIFMYFSGSSVVYKLFNELRQGIQYVREIDSALVELRKVTDETEESYDRFLKTASKTGEKIGSTISDYTRATAIFAKLGYDINMSSEMAEAAIIYQNVGDGIESADAAAESIISTMKGFGLQASDAMLIVDKFNQVGNEFSITSKGIGDALQRSASALAEGNNTLDESIGLITAANSVVQDPESVGKVMCRH